jgi:3-hydroxy-9,10-secoandrosta-1,3,5(10)-triene-9,17-dione monooxygenase
MQDITTTTLTQEEALARAQAIADTVVRTRIVTAEARRRQPRETIEAMQEAGLVRLLVPRRWGGHELSFDALAEIVIAVGRVDASAAWCLGFLLVHGWLLARFPEEAQQDVWEQNPDALLAVSIIPVGQATPVEGGYLLRGTWNYVSGIDHCQWAMLMGSDHRYFLVPSQDYRIEDTWFVVGLSGSGSNTVVVEEAYVPAHRTVTLADLRRYGQAPGASVNSGGLYQLALPEAFPLPLVSAIVGAAWGAYEIWKNQLSKVTTTLSGERPAEMSHVHIRLAQVFQAIKEAHLVLRHVLDEVRPARPFSEQEQLALRLEYASIATRCRYASQVMFDHSGARANLTANPLRRYAADIAAMTAHTRLNLETASEGYGRFELGVRANTRDPYAS